MFYSISVQAEVITCANANVNITQSLQHAGPSGWGGGEAFNDYDVIGSNTIQEVRIHSGNYIDSIEVIYSNRQIDTTVPSNQNSQGGKHGGEGGNLSILRLQPDEYITKVGGRHGSFIDSLYFETSAGQTLVAGAEGGELNFLFETAQNSQIQGFFGQAGMYIDAIGVIFRSDNVTVTCNDN
jgi:hypothetical protein